MKAIEHSLYTPAVARTRLYTERANNTIRRKNDYVHCTYITPRLINSLHPDLIKKITNDNIKSKLYFFCT